MPERSEPVVVEQKYDASRAALWKAITDHKQMIEWFFEDIPEFNAEAGFQTQFDVQAGEQNFRHLWKITEAVAEERIVYDWRYEEFPGVGKVTFEVFEEGNGSRLRVTCQGVETFPQEIPEFSRESCEEGWEYFVQGNLKSYLES